MRSMTVAVSEYNSFSIGHRVQIEFLLHDCGPRSPLGIRVFHSDLRDYLVESARVVVGWYPVDGRGAKPKTMGRLELSEAEAEALFNLVMNIRVSSTLPNMQCMDGTSMEIAIGKHMYLEYDFDCLPEEWEGVEECAEAFLELVNRIP